MQWVVSNPVGTTYNYSRAFSTAGSTHTQTQTCPALLGTATYSFEATANSFSISTGDVRPYSGWVQVFERL